MTTTSSGANPGRPGGVAVIAPALDAGSAEAALSAAAAAQPVWSALPSPAYGTVPAPIDDPVRV